VSFQTIFSGHYKPAANPVCLAIYQHDTFWPIDIANMANTNKPMDSTDSHGHIQPCKHLANTQPSEKWRRVS